MSAADSKNVQRENKPRRLRYDGDVKRTANDTDTQDSESDLDQDANFIDESVIHEAKRLGTTQEHTRHKTLILGMV